MTCDITRRAFILSIAGASLALIGCGEKTIKGSVKDVVDEAQGLDSDAKATIRVSGYYYEDSGIVDNGNFKLVTLTDKNDSFVLCFFEKLSDDEADKIQSGNQVTVEGSYDSEFTDTHRIGINECRLI